MSKEECTSVLDILAAASAHPVATIALYVESNTDRNEYKHLLVFWIFWLQHQAENSIILHKVLNLNLTVQGIETAAVTVASVMFKVRSANTTITIQPASVVSGSRRRADDIYSVEERKRERNVGNNCDLQLYNKVQFKTGLKIKHGVWKHLDDFSMLSNKLQYFLERILRLILAWIDRISRQTVWRREQEWWGGTEYRVHIVLILDFIKAFLFRRQTKM
ncbi:hypothetical protein MSG28_012007 [Choristoneura fumiferana]|uniref:Uncharacterized protein n=1 Tax=Choristoneura fumiferana TaxID=7141 RepID=A0ACC0KP00_CHOFU|nr:hypothetical protein MSG28_012007 [Choristoneura fumiferana]